MNWKGKDEGIYDCLQVLWCSFFNFFFSNLIEASIVVGVGSGCNLDLNLDIGFTARESPSGKRSKASPNYSLQCWDLAAICMDGQSHHDPTSHPTVKRKRTALNHSLITLGRLPDLDLGQSVGSDLGMAEPDPITLDTYQRKRRQKLESQT